MKIKSSANDELVSTVLEEIKRASDRGLTARELGRRFGCDAIKFYKPLHTLHRRGLLRSEWTPVVPKEDHVLQESRYWLVSRDGDITIHSDGVRPVHGSESSKSRREENPRSKAEGLHKMRGSDHHDQGPVRHGSARDGRSSSDQTPTKKATWRNGKLVLVDI